MIVAGDLPPSRGSSFSQVVIRLGNGEAVEQVERLEDEAAGGGRLQRFGDVG